MTLGEAKNKVYMLLDEHSAGGEVEHDEDIEKKMTAFFDTAQKTLAQIRRIVREYALPLAMGKTAYEMPPDFSALWPILTGIVVLVAVTALAQWLMGLCNNRMTYLTVRDIRRDAFAHIQRLPLSYLDQQSTGDVVSRVITDVDQFADGLLMGFTQLFSGVLTIVGTLVFMLSVNVVITAVVVVITPVSLVVAAFIAKRTYDMFRLQSQVRGEQTGFVEEMVQGQKVVLSLIHI